MQPGAARPTRCPSSPSRRRRRSGSVRCRRSAPARGRRSPDRASPRRRPSLSTTQRIATCGPSPTWQISRASTPSIWPLAFDTTPIGTPAAASRSSAARDSGIAHRHSGACRVAPSSARRLDDVGLGAHRPRGRRPRRRSPSRPPPHRPTTWPPCRRSGRGDVRRPSRHRRSRRAADRARSDRATRARRPRRRARRRNGPSVRRAQPSCSWRNAMTPGQIRAYASLSCVPSALCGAMNA